jgi:hypothetical protein
MMPVNQFGMQQRYRTSTTMVAVGLRFSRQPPPAGERGSVINIGRHRT